MVQLPSCGVAVCMAGSGSPWERLACGIADKAGIRLDMVDVRTQTWSLVYVLRGRGSYRSPTGPPIPLAPGDCFVRIPGAVHSTVLDPRSGWREAYIGLGPRLSAALHDAGWLQRCVPTWRWGLTAGRVARFAWLRDRLRTAQPADLPLLAPRALSLIADAMAAAPAEERTDPLVLAADLLSAEMPVSPQQVAARLGLGYEVFRRRFRERYGMAPARWGRSRRLDRACTLLTSTALPVAAIARRLGYVNPFAFSNRFTDRIGCSPSAFRQRGA